MLKIRFAKHDWLLCLILFVLLISILCHIFRITDFFSSLKFFFGIFLFFIPGYFLIKSFYPIQNEFRFVLYLASDIIIAGLLSLFFIFYRDTLILTIIYILITLITFLIALKRKAKLTSDIFVIISNKRAMYLIFVVLSLVLFLVSWWLSFPTNYNGFNEFTILNFHPLYWLSFVLCLFFLFLLYNSTSRFKIWVSLLIMFIIFSSYFFYYSFPGPDSHYFMALTEKYIAAKIDITSQGYFQWPSFFGIVHTFSQLTGIVNVDKLAVLFFLLEGFLLFGGLYVYYARLNSEYAIFSLLSYCLLLFYFLNFQFAPQTLALALLVVMFLLVEEISTQNNSSKQNNLFLRGLIYASFIVLVTMHAFIAAFFILYIVFFYFLNLVFRKTKSKFGYLTIFTIIFYLSYTLLISSRTFVKGLIRNINKFLHYGISSQNQEYVTLSNKFLETQSQVLDLGLNTNYFPNHSQIIKTSLLSVIDNVLQVISRFSIFILAMMNFTGCLNLSLKKKMSLSAFAIFFAGLSYFLLGLVFDILGIRALQVICIPLAVGIIHWLKNFSKLKTWIFLLMIIFSLSLVAHSNFRYSSYQDPADKLAAEYLVEHIEQQEKSYIKLPVLSIFASKQSADWISAKISLPEKYEFVWYDYKKRKNYDYVIWNINSMRAAEKNLLLNQNALFFYEKYFDENYNLIYADGYNKIYSKI